jgi:hypothetical protein
LDGKIRVHPVASRQTGDSNPAGVAGEGIGIKNQLLADSSRHQAV